MNKYIVSNYSDGGGSNYSLLGSSKINGVLLSTKKLAQDYAETVCKEFLKSAEVSNQYDGTTSKIIGHAETKKHSEIEKMIQALQKEMDYIIDDLLKTKAIIENNLKTFNSSIVSVLKASEIYAYYFAMRWLKKLDNRLDKLYGR